MPDRFIRLNNQQNTATIIFLHACIVFLISILLSACLNKEEPDSNKDVPTETNHDLTDPKPVISLTLEFTRAPEAGLDPVDVKIAIFKDDIPTSGLTPSVTLTLGSISTVADNGDGTYSFRLTPTQTGEHPVTVSYEGASITRTPLILYDVHSDWGQPMAVEGYVNTEGYEDGVTITPDGEYLFVQTGPFYFMGIFVMQASRDNSGCGGAFSRLVPDRCDHPWINNTIGPYTAPERPGFFNGRFSGTTLLHNANSWGIGTEQALNFALSTMFYGFKRQSDGSFKEPFYVAFQDVNDGIIGPYGLSFLMNDDGTATTLFTFNDPTDPDQVDFDANGTDDAESGFDVYMSTITLGQNNTLGNFLVSGTPGTHPIRGAFNSTLVDFGKTGIHGIAGTQGNSHLYAPVGEIKSIWIDDEFDAPGAGSDRGEISVHILDSGNLDAGTWTKVTLPTNVNPVDSDSHEIQPFFTGTELFFTRSGIVNPEIYMAAYSGTHSQTDFSNNAHWETPQKILAMDPAPDTVGKIISIGEPTIANFNGEEYLYFVYGLIRQFDTPFPVGTGLADVNLQAGFIKRD